VATVESIQIKNLRSLVDTGWIDQKPITILVGKNSAGKSTFARIFPLLKQSVGEKKQSPILWFGQYVDFGQFSVAVHNKTPNAAISFGFKLKVNPIEVERRNPAFYVRNSAKESGSERSYDLEAEISLVKGGDNTAADTVADKLTLKALGHVVVIKFTSESDVDYLEVDRQKIWWQQKGHISHVTFDSAIPKFNFYKERAAIEGEIEGKIYLEEHDPFSQGLASEVRRYVHGNLGDDKVRQIASRLIFAEDEYFLDRALTAGADQKMWIDHILALPSNPTLMKKLKRAILCARLPEILRLIDSTLSAHFSAVRYIEPLRATAQRYYRKQDLAIGELDAKGANVAQFLQGLPPWRRSEFDSVSRRLFGFAVKPRAQGGHIELVLEQNKGGTLVNLADAGVGFSQMLPILLQFWASENARKEYKTRASTAAFATLVVEQPELHLHPAYQATLADLFCETAIHKVGGRTNVIAETHSPALVNRIGSLIAEGKFRAQDVQILLFEQEGKEGQTKIRIASFNREGELSNWPFGFFEPEI
jgi:hypothetical protein